MKEGDEDYESEEEIKKGKEKAERKKEERRHGRDEEGTKRRMIKEGKREG